MEVPIDPTAKAYQRPLEIAGLPKHAIPSTARVALRDPDVGAAFSDHYIMSRLVSSATGLLKHEKLSMQSLHLTQDGPSTFVFFLFAAFGLEAPGEGESFSLPGITEGAPMLPICHWEGLYLALVSRVLQLYPILQENWETDLQHGNFVLHMHGSDAKSRNEPFPVVKLALLLEEIWRLLMDIRFVGHIENEVRKEHATERYRIEYGEAAFRQHFESDWQNLDLNASIQMLDSVEGMLNPHVLSVEQIEFLLWDKYAPIMRRACREHLDINLDLLARRAQLSNINAIPATGTSTEDTCSCYDDCHCRLVCQFGVSICACKDQAAKTWRTIADNTRARNDSLVQAPTQPGSSRGHDRLFGAPTNEMSQMQVAAEAIPDDLYVQRAASQMREMRRAGVPPILQNRRERSNTQDSGLAYVPAVPRTPAPRTKDNYPLELYGSDSGQRYPKFRETTTQPPPPRPVYGHSCYTTDPPVRKPVPSTSTASTTSPTYGPGYTASPQYPSAFQSSSPEPEPPRTNKSRFPFLPSFKGKTAVTESFPAPGLGNPRQPDNDFQDWDTSHVATPNIAPQHGGMIEEIERHHSPFGRHSADSSAPRTVRPPATMTRSNTADTAQLPELPLPDFIAPRPALKQRYVSAGGTAKLKDRPEIADFALPPAANSGLKITKDEIMARLHAGEFTSPPRSSADAVPRGSQEESFTSDSDARGEKRDRTASNSSSFKAGFKRVFSRSHSESQ